MWCMSARHCVTEQSARSRGRDEDVVIDVEVEGDTQDTQMLSQDLIDDDDGDCVESVGKGI